MSSPGERFGELVLARRAELDLSQMDVWQAGGPSNTTLTEIENGRLERLTRTTAKKLDVGLQWESGSAKRAWEGGEPQPLVKGVAPENSAYLRQAILEADLEPDTRAELLRVLDSA